ncbi:hypothetical protein K402DRAFT_340428 [Aulographum hederae CBS 113979]|uniref:Homeobox domain-containing protein n=1 Tax=Aulographum hederae CBS 113979 TaxID=1176131 RepID=A0A6G1GNE3_9PEZI|nr:hypothetical protein K402DRAFT_340428 [Aulographum hederae CBS 113979]
METPSPANSAHANNSARRPPRKSTLTQQQKNQKRQRATNEQLATLEVEFNKNPTPSAIVRERIASEINMTERSVQIWFQNRRAKIKNIAKKSIESGEDVSDIPESMRRYLAIQAQEGKGFPNMMAGRGYGASYGGGMLLNAENSSTKVVIHHFACRSLSIGSWRRIGQSAMDLVIFYSPEKCCVTYYINNDSAGYKIEYPFSAIKSIALHNPEMVNNAEGATQQGGLFVELNRPPLFYMDSSGSGGFFQCGDFTEDQQASQVLIHHLGGHPKVLSGQLAKLVSLESFQHRFNPYNDPHAVAASAPVSPVGHRPASQPNGPAHPPMGMFPEPSFPAGLHPHRGLAHGHKRQRSRSVPIAMDLSMLRQPMQSFLVHQQPSPWSHNPEILAPVAQHGYPSNAPMGHTLSIDTSAGYGMDLGRQYPMSATTAPSPSDYGTPANFFTTGAPAENMPAANFPMNYSQVPFLTPMPENTNNNGSSAMSPMPQMHHGDPVIANQSPPMTSSADLFSMSHDQHLPDDMQLGEMDPKYAMQLPFRGTMHEDQSNEQDMNTLFNFGATVDPSNLTG